MIKPVEQKLLTFFLAYSCCLQIVQACTISFRRLRLCSPESKFCSDKTVYRKFSRGQDGLGVQSLPLYCTACPTPPYPLNESAMGRIYLHWMALIFSRGITETGCQWRTSQWTTFPIAGEVAPSVKHHPEIMVETTVTAQTKCSLIIAEVK